MPTVLYAEDDPEHRAMVRVVLKKSNISMIEATDGKEAVEKIQAHFPDLILLDLFMPRLDGFGVLKEVKSNPATRHIPIIVLSAWPTGDNRKRARQAGASDFVAKPYDPIQLGNLVNEYLSATSGGALVVTEKPDTAPLPT